MTTSRSSRPWLLACLLGAVSILTATAAASAQEYKIKINRAEKVGDTYTLSAKGSSDNQTNAIIPGAPPQTQEKKDEIELVGTVKVLEVDGHGQATKLSCTVDKCVLNDKPLCDKGDVITAEHVASKTEFTVKGEKVDAATEKALSIVIDTADAEQKSDDDTSFGTDQPQKVGGTWPVHGEAIANELTRRGMAVKAENVKGTGKLAEVKQVDGKDVLTVVVDVTIDGVKPPLPPNVTVESGSLSLHMAGQLPADENAPPLSQTAEMGMKIQATAPGPNNQNITVDVSFSQKADKTFGKAKE